MSNTAGLNIANVQVFAEYAAALDRVSGVYDANVASDKHYYLWQSEFQTIPMGMHANPEQFIEKIVLAIPNVNCLRVPFNLNSFNADGTLDPLFERFLIAAASHGLQLIPVLADGDSQKFEGTSIDIQNALAAEIIGDVRQGWALMKAWMANHAAVAEAVYGWELLNEPATYQRAISSAAAGDREVVRNEMVALYVDHMAELAALVSEGSDARVLVDAWGYGGDTATLSEVILSGLSAIDSLRIAIGDDLVWSLHFYPGWMGTGNMTDPSALQAVLSDLLSPLTNDDVLMTEINASGATTYNPFQPDQVTTATALSLDWLKASGIGIGWFPAVQTGASGLALIERDGDVRYLNQPSLAAALNAFSSGNAPPTQDQAEFIRPTLVEAVLRNQLTDPDYVLGRFDPVDFAGFGFGYGGDDTIIGSSVANNFLYGGDGHDLVAGSNHDDYVFGQDGDDFIVSGDGIDYLFGGKGNDTLVGDHLNNTAFGGDGADIFVLNARSHMVIADFSATDHDIWMGPSVGRYVGHTILDANSDDQLDLCVKFSDGAEILFLGIGDTLNMIAALSGLLPHSETAARLGERLIALSQVGAEAADPLWADWTGNLTLVGIATESLVGSVLADSLVGGWAKDTINAGGGSDIVYGGADGDRIDGYTGNDLIFGDADADFLFGGSGDDTIIGGTGNDIISGGAGSNVLCGGEGKDCIRGSSQSDSVTGGIGNDTMWGDNGSDFISGDDGEDAICGGAGNDTMYGGIGSDCLTGGSGNDLIFGAAGIDTAFFIGTAAAIVNLALTTAQNTGYGYDKLIEIENVTTGGGSDTLTGDFRANLMCSGAGNDKLYGGAGNDSLHGGIGNDLMVGGTGVDSVFLIGTSAAVVNLALITAQNTGYGNDKLIEIENVTTGGGNDVLIGDFRANTLSSGAGNDRISGGNGNDTLIGGVGNDTIVGGAGNDKLTGGLGSDCFIFSAKFGSGYVDQITDFNVIEDSIWLKTAIFTGLFNGALSTSAFVANSTGLAADALDRIIYENDTGKLFYDVDGTGNCSRVVFATLTPGLALSHADFFAI